MLLLNWMKGYHAHQTNVNVNKSIELNSYIRIRIAIRYRNNLQIRKGARRGVREGDRSSLGEERVS